MNGDTREPLTRETPDGEPVDVTAAAIVAMANHAGRTVVGTHNDFELTAKPGDKPEDVVAPWWLNQRGREVRFREKREAERQALNAAPEMARALTDCRKGYVDQATALDAARKALTPAREALEAYVLDSENRADYWLKHAHPALGKVLTAEAAINKALKGEA